MDIAAISTTLSQVELGTKVGTAVLDKAMDSNEELAQGLVQMIDAAAMERSVAPGVGSIMDVRV